MFIPLTSDASLKYWPIATVSFILVHILVLVIQNAIPPREPREDEFDDPNIAVFVIRDEPIPGWYDYMLSHGDGLHPVQWVTSMLMHGNVAHLIGNMIFLWVFGHVVEGIVGPWAFSGLYLGMGILQNFLGQLMFLGFPSEPSLGASGAIYSLMALAALWAPQDNIQSVLWIMFTFWLVNIPILIFALFYVLWDLGLALLQSFSLSTELLHVTGAAVGLGTGMVLLGSGKIDCDERDMLSMIREARGKPLPRKGAPKAVPAKEPTAEEMAEKARKLAFAWKTFDAHLASGHPDSAISQLQIVRKFDKDVQWDESRLLRLIQSLQSSNRFDDVLRYSEIYLSLFASRAQFIRLNMAKILVIDKGLPRKALKALASVNVANLDPHNRQVAQNLARQCQRLIDEGSIETRDD